jgi:hypothetical protein
MPLDIERQSLVKTPFTRPSTARRMRLNPFGLVKSNAPVVVDLDDVSEDHACNSNPFVARNGLEAGTRMWWRQPGGRPYTTRRLGIPVVEGQDP